MKKLIFALFPFALLFGKTEIRLQTIDYEPFVEEMVAEIELKDGEIVSQTINGKEATEEDFEKLAEETGEQIGFETEIVSFQQNAIAEYVGTFLESKGIEYENYGTKLVVDGKLDPEIVAEITAGFSFVESIEEVEEEVPTASSYKTIDQARKDTNINPYGDLNIYVASNSQWNSYITDKPDIGIMLWEQGACPDLKAQDKNKNSYIDKLRISNYTKTAHWHPTYTGTLLQKASKFSFVHCLEKGKSIKQPNSYSPPIYISSHSYGEKNKNSYSNYNNEIDDFIYKNKIASFFAAGNEGVYAYTPGTSYNAISIGYRTDVAYKDQINGGAIKPEFIGHGYFDFQGSGRYTDVGGSSLSTPFVASGFGANILHQYPYLKYQPQGLKALLLTMAKTTNGKVIDEKEGAGYLNNYTKFYNTHMHTWNMSMSNVIRQAYKGSYPLGVHTNNIVYSYKLYKNKKYKIALSWLASENCGHIFPELDIYLYKQDKVVASSNIKDSNFELFEFTPNSTDTYTFIVKPDTSNMPNNKVSFEVCRNTISNLYITLVINEQ
jgi:hypothetical protein